MKHQPVKISARQRNYLLVCKQINNLTKRLEVATTPADAGTIAARIDDLQDEARDLRLAARQ